MSTSEPVAIAPLQHKNLREQARRVLRTSIITGELEPGHLYTVGFFAQKLGVSITPVREALNDLAHRGLVEIRRNRGFIVPVLTDHDLDEIFQIRLMLEAPALMEVAGHLPADVRKSCRKLVHQGKAAAAQGDLTLFLEADREFHMQLIAPLDNHRLVDILNQLRDQTRLYGLRQLAASGLLDSSALEHEVLLTAIEVGDTEAVGDLIARHLKHTRGAWAGRVETP
jgi:DNA-binding GntR family transcriptional regulator